MNSDRNVYSLSVIIGGVLRAIRRSDWIIFQTNCFSEGLSVDCCLTPTQQFSSYIMARTS